MSVQSIPLVNVAATQAEVLEEIAGPIDEILRGGGFIGGPHVAAFEEEYARFSETDYCVGVANGTDALEIALRAVGVGVGDEVVLPANTFVATAEAVARIGARAVLVDVDEAHLLIRPDAVAAALTERTKAVVPVHLYGQLAPVEALAKLSLPLDCSLVEDAAQSQGARRNGSPSASSGRIAATSFYPGKNLGAAGDAGAITTNDPVLARVCRVMSAHGSETRYVHEAKGFNSRLDALQAVVLRAKLRRLDRWNVARRSAAQRYDELLQGLEGVRLPQAMAGNDHVWHLYTIRVPNRAQVLSALHEQGVGAAIHYPTPVHLTPAFSDLGYVAGDFPVAEEAAASLISLPLDGHIDADQQERVAEALRLALGRGREAR